MRFGSFSIRLLLGALLGCAAFLITRWLSGLLISPYVVAFAAVLLSFWLWQLVGAAATALASGLLIEYFFYSLHRMGFTSPVVTGPRTVGFFVVSIGIGALIRRSANEKARQTQLAAERQMALVQAERQRVLERQQFTDLARENQIRTELALEGADLGLWEWNLETNKSRWSSNFYRLHGVEATEEAGYEFWRSLVDPEDLPKLEREIQDAIAAGESFTSEYRLGRRDERAPERWIAIGGNTVRKDGERPVAVAGYCLDITRRKNTEAALMRTEKLAVAGRLAASIAHEINNPLEAVVNLIYLSRNGEPRACAGYLDEAMIQLNRVSTIAQQMLRFARRQDGPGVCVPSAVLEGVLTLLRSKLGSMGVDVVQRIHSERAVSCNPGELQQVVTNIINNAVDAMREGGTLRIRVKDAVQCRGDAIRGVRITISDSGTGMSPEVFRRMKEPFFTTKSETGTGLGMWVAYELVERNRGSLLVRTRTTGRGRGTIFSLFLPEASSSCQKRSLAEFSHASPVDSACS